MSKISLDYRTTYVGLGIHALFCWRSDCLCPAGMILYNACGDGNEGVDARTRIDIIHIYVLPESRKLGIGKSMIKHLQQECDVMHTPVAADSGTEALLESCGFGHDSEAINWIWKKQQKPRLESGIQVDATLAGLLGWKGVALNDVPGNDGKASKLLCGSPPGSEEVRPVPSYSSDISIALSLIVELSERYHLDYQWWKFGGMYSCGVRKEGAPGDFADHDTSPWYECLPVAICHALIAYLTRLQQARAEAKAAEQARQEEDAEIDKCPALNHHTSST